MQNRRVQVVHVHRILDRMHAQFVGRAKRDAALWIITCEAQQATVQNCGVGLVGDALWGLARVLVNEMPQLAIRLLDLSHTAALGERAQQVAAELAFGHEIDVPAHE